MKRIGFCILVAAVMQGLCLADTTNGPAIDEKIARAVARFRELHSATNLPPSVLQLCADLNGRLADPGQKWQESDGSSDDRLPWHRMIWAVTDDDAYIVHYEVMGRVHSAKMLNVEVKLGKVDPDGVQNVWVERPFKDFKDFLEFNYKKK